MADKLEGSPDNERKRKNALLAQAVADMNARLAASGRWRPKERPVVKAAETATSSVAPVSGDDVHTRSPATAVLTASVKDGAGIGIAKPTRRRREKAGVIAGKAEKVAGTVKPSGTVGAPSMVSGPSVKPIHRTMPQAMAPPASGEVTAEDKKKAEEAKRTAKEAATMAAAAVTVTPSRADSVAPAVAAVPDSVSAVSTLLDALVVPALSDSAALRKEVKKIWTQEILLGEIPDGTKVLIKDATGQSKVYKRAGDSFFTTAKKPSKADNAVLRVLNHGGTWEKAEKAAAASTSDTASGTPVVADAERKALLDGLATLGEGAAEEKKEVKKEAGAEQYDKLRQGDVWLHSDGKTRILITNLFRNGAADIRRGTGVTIEDLQHSSYDDGENAVDGILSAHSVTLEKLKQDLREGAYVPEVAGREGEALDVWVPQTKYEADGKIDNLRTTVDLMRLQYVTTDRKQKLSLKKLANFFGFGKSLDGGQSDKDTQATLTAYTAALMKLQEAELAQLKASAIAKGTGWQEEMGRMLNYYKRDEPINLWNDRERVAAEDRKWPGKVMEYWENIGKGYNKLSPKQKILIAGVCFGTAGAAFITGGAAVGAAASTLIGIRKIFTTFGAGVVIDGMIEGSVEWLRVRGVEKEQEEELEELRKLNVPDFVPSGVKRTAGEKLSSEALRQLEGFLAKDIVSLEGKFANQKREKIMRKTAAWGTAIGFGSYFALHALFTDTAMPPSGASVKALGAVVSPGVEHPVAPPVGAASAAREAVSASTVPSGAMTPNTGVVPESSLKVPEASSTRLPIMADHTAGPGTETVASKVDIFREEYKVTTADGKKGLWGVLERRLPADFQGNKNGAIQSLENAMRAKLDAMSPADRALAGFHGNLSNGRVNLDLIRLNDKIDFGKLLTPQEIQSVLEGKSIVAPSVADAAGIVVQGGLSPIDQNIIDSGGTPLSAGTAGNGDILERLEKEKFPEFERALDKISNSGYRNEVLPPPNGSPAVMEAYNSIGNAREYLLAHPDKLSVFKSSLGHLREEIFSTSEVQKLAEQSAGPIVFTSPELGKVSVSQVLRDYQALKSNPFTSYDHDRNPLHFSQMQQLDRLLAASGKAYGEVGTQVPAGTTIDDLTKRLAAMGYQEEKGIPRFLKIKP